MTVSKFAAFGIFFMSFIMATSASANCSGVPQINLSDGSKGCVVQKGTTELTSSQFVLGGGPATTRKSKSEGGVVMVRFPEEVSAKVTTRNAIHKRAREICGAYKNEFLTRIAKPGNPFIVVVMGWGPNPAPNRFSKKLSPFYRELYLTRNCRVKHSK